MSDNSFGPCLDKISHEWEKPTHILILDAKIQKTILLAISHNHLSPQHSAKKNIFSQQNLKF
jgi:hypothetical protein